MTTQAIIFDLDGTLLDTLADIADAMNAALLEVGAREYPSEAYKDFVGSGAEVLVRAALPGALPAGSEAPTEKLVQDTLSALRRHYAQRLLNKTQPYPGVLKLLTALKQRQVICSVLSNKPHQPTCQLVEALFAEDTFHSVFGQREGIPKKPDPQVALSIAAAMGAPASACIFVGDTAVDIETAKRANMRPIGVDWGFRDERELRAAGAEAIVTDPLQLLQQIG